MGEVCGCEAWSAFVCLRFVCALVVLLEVCRVRFARVSCPRLRFEESTSISWEEHSLSQKAKILMYLPMYRSRPTRTLYSERRRNAADARASARVRVRACGRAAFSAASAAGQQTRWESIAWNDAVHRWK